MTIYDIPIPSNAEIYIKEFTKLIEFDILNPDSLIGMFSDNKNFKLMDWVMGKD